MKYSSTLVAICAVMMPTFVIAAVGPINTPSPIQAGAYPHCEQFYKASPGVTCGGVAAAHSLTLLKFLQLNPQVGGLVGCMNNLLPHWWYCVKGLDANNIDTPAGLPTSTTLAVVLLPPPTTQTAQPQAPPNAPPNPTPANTITATPPPPTPLECATDNCWRAFKLARYGASISQSSWCTKFLTSPCSEPNLDLVPGLPNAAKGQCTQGPPCKVISSACACYTAGLMNTKKARMARGLGGRNEDSRESSS